MKDKVYDYIEPLEKENGVNIASTKKKLIAPQHTTILSNDLVNEINGNGQKISSLTEGSTSSISSILSSTSSSNSHTYNNFTEPNGVDSSEIEVEVAKDKNKKIVDKDSNKRDLTENELKVI